MPVERNIFRYVLRSSAEPGAENYELPAAWRWRGEEGDAGGEFVEVG